MQKPLINNRRLNEKWSAQTNELMIKKLQGVKPQINSRCPESFFFYKTQFKKPNLNTNKLAKLEIAKNNETLLRKLLDANIERNSKSNTSRQPVFSFKKNFLTGNKKYDIIKIAQENQSMLKRLNERSSFYDVNKWERDYQMNQYYKRNHCMFPSIDFKKSNSGIFNSTVKSMPGELSTGGLSIDKKKYNNSCTNFNQLDNYQEENNEKSNFIQINEDTQDKDYPKLLFKTQVYLGILGSCIIEFAVQTQSFTIKIESVYEKERIYGIIFDSRKFENIQKYYRKYEEMIKELEYDEKNDVVKFNNIIKKDLICRCLKLPPKSGGNMPQGDDNQTKEQNENKDNNIKQNDNNEKDKEKDTEKAIETNNPAIKTDENINKINPKVISEAESNKTNEEMNKECIDHEEQINKNKGDKPNVEDIPKQEIEDKNNKERKVSESNLNKQNENNPDIVNKNAENEKKEEEGETIQEEIEAKKEEIETKREEVETKKEDIETKKEEVETKKEEIDDNEIQESIH